MSANNRHKLHHIINVNIFLLFTEKIYNITF
jgi:hypothetical protein